jgi:serine/threonine-protein kinase
MGVVFESMRAGRPVAIKIPYRETLADAYSASRFRDEGVAGSVVTHPNVARVVDAGESAGVPYLVMERVIGERLCTQRRELSLHEIATLARQILDGLDALHAAGIVHGDVKSDNVLLARDAAGNSIAKLIDFGLAHELDAIAVTEDGLVPGTPEYMAPEVIRGEGSTPASDLYAVGVILYELLVGETPFCTGDASAIAYRQLVERIVPPSLR